MMCQLIIQALSGIGGIIVGVLILNWWLKR
jgi:hypothetical protein